MIVNCFWEKAVCCEKDLVQLMLEDRECERMFRCRG